MINGKMKMSGEFGSIRVETIVTYMKVYYTFYNCMIKKQRSGRTLWISCI